MPRIPVAVVTACLLLAACGEEGPGPRERLREAARVMGETRSAAYSVEMEIRTAGDAAGPGLSLTGDGSYDFERGLGRLRMEIGGPGMSLEMIRDSSGVYVRMPAIFTDGEPQWLREAVSDTAGSTLTSRRRVYRFLERYEGRIRSLGDTTTAEGTRLSGYALSVTGREIWPDPDSVPEDVREGLPPGLQRLRGMEVPTEVWLDDRQRIRRLAVRIGMEDALAAAREASGDAEAGNRIGALAAMLGTAPGDTLEMRVALSEFGIRVDPGLPEGARVVPMEQFRETMEVRKGSEETAPAGGGPS